MKALYMIASTILVIWGVNWWLVAFDFNLVTYLFWSWPMVEKTVYGLVWMSALVVVGLMFTKDSCCNSMSK